MGYPKSEMKTLVTDPSERRKPIPKKGKDRARLTSMRKPKYFTSLTIKFYTFLKKNYGSHYVIGSIL